MRRGDVNREFWRETCLEKATFGRKDPQKRVVHGSLKAIHRHALLSLTFIESNFSALFNFTQQFVGGPKKCFSLIPNSLSPCFSCQK